MDFENLYRKVIMDHYKNPHHKGLKDDPEYKKIHFNNPSCGDKIDIQIKLEDDLIADCCFDGQGCSICCSSASVMSDLMIGKPKKEGLKLTRDFFKLVSGDTEIDSDLGDGYAYQTVSLFPARIKCATLPWKALELLLEDKDGN